MAKKVTIRKADGTTITITVSNDSAREYERLPFEQKDVVSVDVTNA